MEVSLLILLWTVHAIWASHLLETGTMETCTRAPFSCVSESLLCWSSEVPCTLFAACVCVCVCVCVQLRARALPVVWSGWELIALYIEVYVCGGLRLDGAGEKGRLAEHTNEGYAGCSMRVVYLGVCSASYIRFARPKWRCKPLRVWAFVCVCGWCKEERQRWGIRWNEIAHWLGVCVCVCVGWFHAPELSDYHTIIESPNFFFPIIPCYTRTFSSLGMCVCVITFFRALLLRFSPVHLLLGIPIMTFQSIAGRGELHRS